MKKVTTVTRKMITFKKNCFNAATIIIQSCDRNYKKKSLGLAGSIEIIKLQMLRDECGYYLLINEYIKLHITAFPLH